MKALTSMSILSLCIVRKWVSINATLIDIFSHSLHRMPVFFITSYSCGASTLVNSLISWWWGREFRVNDFWWWIPFYLRFSSLRRLSGWRWLVLSVRNTRVRHLKSPERIEQYFQQCSIRTSGKSILQIFWWDCPRKVLEELYGTRSQEIRPNIGHYTRSWWKYTFVGQYDMASVTSERAKSSH